MEQSGIDYGETIRDRVGEVRPRLVSLRRDLHRHPELGFDTPRTTARIIDELHQLGLQPKTGIGRTGVVAEIAGAGPGPIVLVRADFDALPIHEETGLSFASVEPGRMHACGHDIHTATLIGVGHVLAGLRNQFHGTVRLVFQPAEEIPDSGAFAMVSDGAADGATIGIAFHNWPEIDVGKFGYTEGTAMGSGDEFDVIVHGVGGHAARPAQSIDPIVTAAAMIVQLQTAISRSNDPLHPSVLTIGSINAGTTYNIIPETCSFRGTIRCLAETSRDIMKRALHRICAGVADSMGATCEINFIPGVPPLVNDPELLWKAVDLVRRNFGFDSIAPSPSLFETEDFSYFSERIPSVHLLVGSSQPGRRDRLHSPFYEPDEDSISFGAEALSGIILDLMADEAWQLASQIPGVSK